jgi:NOL1/NOP2/fmu family ribosome biogenesis protein
MKQLRILNTRDVREIIEKLEKQYDCELEFDFAFLADPNDKIFVVDRDVAQIDFGKLRINSVGLYFGEVTKNGEIRLTMEGSQIVGKRAQKNIVDLDEGQVRSYFLGEEVAVDVDVTGFVLLRFRGDFFGAAKYKEGKILNYLPKYHRTKELII